MSKHRSKKDKKANLTNYNTEEQEVVLMKSEKREIEKIYINSYKW